MVFYFGSSHFYPIWNKLALNKKVEMISFEPRTSKTGVKCKDQLTTLAPYKIKRYCISFFLILKQIKKIMLQLNNTEILKLDNFLKKIGTTGKKACAQWFVKNNRWFCWRCLEVSKVINMLQFYELVQKLQGLLVYSWFIHNHGAITLVMSEICNIKN